MGVSGHEYKNRVGLSQEKLALLEEDFSRLASVDADLPGEALRYVLDGANEDVLDRLARTAGCAEALGLLCCEKHLRINEPTCRARFLSSPATEDEQFYLRLVKAWEAAAAGLNKATFVCLGPLEDVRWLEILLAEATALPPSVYTGNLPRTKLSTQLLERMLTADGKPSEIVAMAPLRGWSQKNQWVGRRLKEMLRSFEGYGDTLTRHAPSVIEWLDTADAGAKVEALKLLAEAGACFDRYVETLVGLATSPAKTVRTEAAALLAGVPEAAVPLIQRVAADGTAPERLCAVELLGRFVSPGVRQFLAQRKEEETAKKVLGAIDGLLGESEPSKAQSRVARFDLPSLEPVDPHAPLSPAAREAFGACIDDCNQRLAALRQQPQQPWTRQIDLIPPEQVEQSLRFIEGLRAKATTKRLLGHMSFALNEGRETLSNFVRRKDIQWIHVVRLLVLLGCLPVAEHDRFYFAWPSPYFHAFREAHPGAGGLREIAAAMQAARLDDFVLGRALLTDFFWPTRWRDADTWPYFAERIVLLEEAFGLAPGLRVDSWWRAQYREHAFRVLKAFPHLPDNLAGKMWEIALGEGKTERPLAQAVLENTADVTDKVAAALADGKYATRVAAAEWLGKLKATGCIPQLRKSLAKEKHDAAADAMMRALEALGVSAAEFLDRNALADDAAKGLKKRTRAVLTWFPFDRLPDVHWDDTGEPVPRDVLVWFLIKAHKLNKPEPGPMLVRYCEMFRPAEREALGQFVLETWIEQDTIPFTPQEARARAQREAAQLAPYFPGKSVAEVTESLYNQYCNSPSGSATSAKGILAVAGACCGERGVEEIGRYIHFWYGYRAAQCKALVATLASIEVRPAVQLLLSIANRFRTKGIREEAARYVHVLAERKGWTVDQLADRMIPTGGLDDTGRLELDLGPRTLVARLDPSLKVILTGADGKPLKSFPKQGKQDDDEKYRQAKKLFSSAKQEVKTTVRRQTERLFEAMCTQRTWTIADWDTYLKGHPIVGNLCRGLVWAVGSGDEPQQWFRPMEDGSLTDCTDEEVHVDPAAVVRLAHDYNTPPDRATQWAEHLADYEIAPLFPQFGRDLYRLPEAMRDRTEITEFQGYLVQAFSLRGRATKLGYTRGETGDAGWFYQYQRHLPGLSLDVEIQFSGNALPEENRTVAMKSLRFRRKPHEGGAPSMPMPLGDVPPVLLSECYNDLRGLAQLGTGFDPDWEKKVE